MDERDARGDLDDLMTDEPGDDSAMDIVSRTGEEMPLAMHDQGHRDFRAAVADDAFDPRLPARQYARRSP